MDMQLDWLKQWNLYSPNAPAFKDVETGTVLSYADLYRLSCGIASRLKEQFGLMRGRRIAVLSGTRIEYIPLFFAIQRLGAVMVPVNTRLSTREIAHILKDAKPDVLVYHENFASTVNGLRIDEVPDCKLNFVTLRQMIRETMAEELSPFEMRGEYEDPCMILYTSGTTGLAKGAIVTNKMLHWNSLNTTLRLNLNQNDVAVSFLPLFHTGGWNVLLTPFVHRGACTILMRRFEADRVLSLCASEGVTVLFGVPTTMDMMHRSPLFEKVDLSSIRYAVVGGEPMPLELIKRWGEKKVPVRQGYGLTEFGPNVFSLNESDALRKMGSIGFPNFYIEARVVGPTNKELPAGEVGELVLRGPSCMPGYWNNPVATAEAIQDGWLHTGDLVRKDDEGYYYVAGRKKDMYISGAENVYPAETERYLSLHPAVREIAVIGVPDARWGEVGKAYIALRSGFTLTAEEVIAYCLTGLAKYKSPKHVEFMSELPKGDSGKILKRRLREALGLK